MADQYIYQEALKSGGGSGRGVSYWSVPALCGRKRKLMTEHKDVDPIEDRTALNTGTYYHFLKEWWHKGKMPEDIVIDVDPVQDLDWAEAVRLFTWHRDFFPRDYWGTIVSVEMKMPVNDAHKQRVIDWVGHDESTGACDLVVMMDAADVARISKDRDIELPGPGMYVIDHKTAGTRKTDTDAKANYTESMQCLKYMHMLQLAVAPPVRGMIFDVLIKHRQLRRYPDGRNGSSVQTFFAAPKQEDARIVKAAIDYGMHQRETNLANPFACYSYGRECVFLSRGLCGRY